jgi:putative endopeptidase
MRQSDSSPKNRADRFGNRWLSYGLIARTTACLLPVLAALLFMAANPLVTQSASDDDIDHSVKPGADFYRYANGGWLGKATMPLGLVSYDTRAMLMERTTERVRDLIRDAAARQAPKGSVAQKVGLYFSSFMDEDQIETTGMKPLADEMGKISAVANKQSLSAYLGTTLSGAVEGLTTNADHIFGMWVNQDFERADHNVVHFLQGGLGMPDRDNYLDPSPKMADLRAQYQAHISAILRLAGVPDPSPRAADVLALEIRIAQAFAPDADAADVFKQNNPWKREDFARAAPGLDWGAYFKAAGLERQRDFVVWQPSAVVGVSALVANESTGVWKDYLTFHLIEHYANVLPRAVRMEHFAFFGNIMSGAKQPPNRQDSAIAATNGALGQAVGELYTQRYFPPEAKAQAQTMASNLRTAYRARISNLAWMSPDTKKKALEKLAALEIGIGYPDTWIDYSALDVVRGDAVGNMRRAEAFLRLRNLAKLKQPVDPVEWPINPQIPGAVIMFSPNAEFFSAAILQPPYFDSQGDSASNYGSAGAGMAHEISHSFDELGNIYDARGRLGKWWNADDQAQYHALAAKLAAQIAGYCPLSDLCVNGKQVLNESIADLAGLVVAHDAYILSLKSKDDAMLGGLTGEQRFFLAFAQRWRRLQSEPALRRQIATDSHLPGEFRSDSVRNADAWYKAYDVAVSDKLYLKPEDRVRIW